MAANVIITDMKINDIIVPGNGKPGQQITFKITNNNDETINVVDGQYILTLDGSGCIDPAREKVFDTCLYARTIKPHKTAFMPDGWIIIPAINGRCTSARIIITKAYYEEPPK